MGHTSFGRLVCILTFVLLASCSDQILEPENTSENATTLSLPGEPAFIIDPTDCYMNEYHCADPLPIAGITATVSSNAWDGCAGACFRNPQGSPYSNPYTVAPFRGGGGNPITPMPPEVSQSAYSEGPIPFAVCIALALGGPVWLSKNAADDYFYARQARDEAWEDYHDAGYPLSEDLLEIAEQKQEELAVATERMVIMESVLFGTTAGVWQLCSPLLLAPTP